MGTTNPYQTPSADVTAPTLRGLDQTRPFDPSGRFGRLSYVAWLMLVSITLNLVQFILNLGLGPAGGGAPEQSGFIAIAIIGLTLMLTLLMVVASILFAIRRLHDVDLSGWWLLLSLVPLVNIFLGLFLLLKPGTDGANRFGPPRQTAGWETVVGAIGIGLILLSLLAMIGLLIALSMSPELMQQWQQALLAA
jgi:uncharacterized membrane protein YhaH (DUF805 family)